MIMIGGQKGGADKHDVNIQLSRLSPPARNVG